MSKESVPMDLDAEHKLDRTLFLHELLFSLNIGFAITFVLFAYRHGGFGATHASKPVQRILDGLALLLVRIGPRSTHVPRSVILRAWLIEEVIFVAMMAGIALLLLVFLRTIPQTATRRLILNPVAGITAVVAVPAGWLCLMHATWTISDTGTVWDNYGYAFVLETALAFVFLYFARERKPIWGILTFILHYIFWCVVIVVGRRSGISTSSSILLSVTFPWSGIAWLAYVRQLGTRGATT
jgi:hypothetical protein